MEKKIALAVKTFGGIREISACPICGERLNIEASSLRCPKNHTFNISKKGELFLLNTSHFKPSTIYDKELFQHRRDFIQGNFYENMHLVIVENMKKLDSTQLTILDLGCGEGMHDQLISQGLDVPHILIGIDNSKDAIILATDFISANLLFAVADVTNLPIKDKSIDVVINILSPFNEKEVSRVLKEDGIFIKVSPKEQYLMELRSAFEIPTYTKEEEVSQNILAKFSLVTKAEINQKYSLTNEQLNHLLKMSPLTKSLNKNESKNISEITIALNFFVLKKK